MKFVETLAAFKDVINSDAPVVVDFTASWCGPCRSIGPYFQELAESGKYPGVRFFKVDVDQAQEVAAFCGIKSMPTFKVYGSGEEKDTLSGADRAGLLRMVERAAATVSA